MVYDSANAVHWVNENLIDCMAWQQLPEIQHPIIKITSSLEIYWPSWNQQIKIPNGATKTQIKQLCEEAERKINSAN
jgi:DNA polymerase-1